MIPMLFLDMLPVHLFNVKHRRLDYHRERCQKTDLIRKSLVKSVCSFLSKEITSFSLTIHVSFEQREVGIKLPFDTHLPTEVWPALCSTTMPSRSVKTARVRQAFGQDIFSGGPKGGGEIRSKFRKIFRRWFSFIVKNYEYTKRDLHEMALCVLNEDEWIIYYIYYTYIFIQRYSDFTFVLSLSLSLSPACSPKTHEPLPQESAFNGDSDFRKLSLLLTLWRFRKILRRVIRKIREM